MKLLHLSDLHIGKRLGEFNLAEDQRYILEQIIGIAAGEKPDAVLIAGDVYDRGMPAVEAVGILDDFLTELSSHGISVFMISGNHDSAERLSFGGRIMNASGIHIEAVFKGVPGKVTLHDKYGPVNIYLMPFIKPAMVRPYKGGSNSSVPCNEGTADADTDGYDDGVSPGNNGSTLRKSCDIASDITSYDMAFRAAIGGIVPPLVLGERNVLLAHQFATSGLLEPDRSESENISVGGMDNVDITAFGGFDYVALGHIHKPQAIGRETVRYAGSPLKYSFSEALHEKSVTIVELGEKAGTAIDNGIGTRTSAGSDNGISIRAVPLSPLRDMRVVKGPLVMLVGSAPAEGRDDYVRAILTDRGEIYDAVGRLRHVYPNLMRIDFDNAGVGAGTGVDTGAGTGAGTVTGEDAGKGVYTSADTGAGAVMGLGAGVSSDGITAGRDPAEVFSEFYKFQNGIDMTAEQEALIRDVFREAAGESGEVEGGGII